MSNEEYQLLSIDEARSTPRAMILVLANGKPSAIYEVDIYGYEAPDYIFETELESERLTKTQASLVKEATQ